MELRQLKYFVRIVELGSFSQAAKDLYVAQPALSAQINNLESDLGVRLLSRSVRGVTPTEAGQSLYVHAQAVLRQIERFAGGRARYSAIGACLRGHSNQRSQCVGWSSDCCCRKGLSRGAPSGGRKPEWPSSRTRHKWQDRDESAV